MDKAWIAIEKLVKRDAKHIKKGKRLSQLSDTAILGHAAEELIELASDPEDKVELGDTLACLFHYAIKHGWTKEDIEQEIIDKLNQRFE